MRAAGAPDVTVLQREVLEYLRADGGRCSAAEIGEALGLTTSVAYSRLGALYAKRFVDGTRDHGTRRLWWASAEPPARSLDEDRPCSKCGETKPREAYHTRTTSSGARRRVSRCRDCLNAANMERYRAAREKEPPPPARHCAWEQCGAEIVGRAPSAKYCSRRCSMYAGRARRGLPAGVGSGRGPRRGAKPKRKRGKGTEPRASRIEERPGGAPYTHQQPMVEMLSSSVAPVDPRVKPCWACGATFEKWAERDRHVRDEAPRCGRAT